MAKVKVSQPTLESLTAEIESMRASLARMKSGKATVIPAISVKMAAAVDEKFGNYNKITIAGTYGTGKAMFPSSLKLDANIDIARKMLADLKAGVNALVI